MPASIPKALLRITSAAVVACAAIVGAAHADARGRADKDSSLRETVLAYRLDARLRVPPVVAFDPVRLGHVVVPARLALANASSAPVPLGTRQLEFLARGVYATYGCEMRAPDGDRWPAVLEPGAVTNVERTLACDTPLPGAYEVEVRWAQTPATEPALATAALQVEPGPSAPVPLSTRPALRAVASGTREVEPSRIAGRVRIVLGLTNASAHPVPLPSVVIETSLHLRGSPLVCKDRREVPLTGELDAGRQHVLWMPLSCALPTEGVWEVDVDVGEPSGPPVRLPRHVVRVSAVTRPPPMP